MPESEAIRLYGGKTEVGVGMGGTAPGSPGRTTGEHGPHTVVAIEVKTPGGTLTEAGEKPLTDPLAAPGAKRASAGK